ncbi:hypothetical protein PhCBS80983_g02246 [Powellomyces hirtus]|uniref:Rab-GAP TBC domain-containing protein n=1 Tax=Powellomyces hirtus TaxID=109895 RepID=A0A507E7W0_9FUNG|nr:hypothetical protein PhCBS80983_g02246 [Powellomyces hirtus]
MIAHPRTGPTPPRTLFVGDRRSGPVWTTSEWRNVLAGVNRKGSILRVHNELSPQLRKGTVAPRNIVFTRVCFSKEMRVPSEKTRKHTAYAIVMAAVDQRGGIFVFDFMKNKFWLVAKSGVSGSCLTFNPVRRRELIVGLSDNTIVCYNIEACCRLMPADLQAARISHNADAHPLRPPIAATPDINKSKRVDLVGHRVMGAQKAAPFIDGKILVWSTDTFITQWHIDLGVILGETISVGLNKENCLSLSRNGELMVYAAYSSKLYVWNMVERRLIHEVTIPALEGTDIVQLEFLGSSNVTAVLSNAGDMVFIEVSEARFVGQVEGGHKFRYFTSSPDGRILSTIFRDKGSVLGVVRVDSVLDTPSSLENNGAEVSIILDQPPEEDSGDQYQSPTRQMALPTATTKTLYELMDMKEGALPLNKVKLRKFLMFYGSYPDKYRTLIWRVLAVLPENRSSYEALLEGGAHRIWKDFRTQFPVGSERVAQSMERVLSALAFWASVFAGMELLPALVFPFVKVYLSDMFAGFEIIATVLLNWCQKWWEYHPNPPIECLACVEDLLEFHDKELLDHFLRHKITSQMYAWTMMQPLFSSIFHKDDWLTLWDHLLTNPPWFMYLFVVSYLKSHRIALLRLTKPEDFQFFFTRPNRTVPLATIITSAYGIGPITPAVLHPRTFFEPFKPLPVGEYPVVNQAPSYMVNYQSRMRERIAREEEERFAQKQRNLGREQHGGQPGPQTHQQGSTATGIVDAWWTRMVEDEKHAYAARQNPTDAGKPYGEARRGFLRAQMDKPEHADPQGVQTDARANKPKEADVDENDEWAKLGRETQMSRDTVLRGGAPEKPSYMEWSASDSGFHLREDAREATTPEDKGPSTSQHSVRE